jgi:hypothetical protein
MNLRERIRSWLQPIYFLGQNTLTLTGAVITTSTALTTIAFWFYEIFLPAPPHPYIGILRRDLGQQTFSYTFRIFLTVERRNVGGCTT